jgi:hypothetical protein
MTITKKIILLEAGKAVAITAVAILGACLFALATATYHGWYPVSEDMRSLVIFAAAGTGIEMLIMSGMLQHRWYCQREGSASMEG